MNNDTLLSIIVPTRNRQKYALELIKMVLSIKSRKIELIIEDNSDSDSLYKNLITTKLIEDERLKYNYNSVQVSFVKNFNNAMERANGEYIMFLGDDDGVLPEIVDLAEWALVNKLESVQYNRSISYIWPDDNSKGVLTLRGFNFKIKRKNGLKNLVKMLKAGDFYYVKYKLIEVYHGLIKKSLFDKVKEKNGYYFGGLTPDIYASISLTLLVQNYTYIDYPFSYHGVSPRSGSAQSRSGEHTNRDLYKAPHFFGQDNYIWSPQIPEIYTVSTIWAETAVKAIIENEVEYYKNINWSRLFKNINLRHPYFYEEIKKCANQNDIRLSKNLIGIKIFQIQQVFKKYSLYFIRLVKYILLGRKKLYNIKNVREVNSKIVINKNYVWNNKRLIKFLNDGTREINNG